MGVTQRFKYRTGKLKGSSGNKIGPDEAAKKAKADTDKLLKAKAYTQKAKAKYKGPDRNEESRESSLSDLEVDHHQKTKHREHRDLERHFQYNLATSHGKSQDYMDKEFAPIHALETSRHASNHHSIVPPRIA